MSYYKVQARHPITRRWVDVERAPRFHTRADAVAYIASLDIDGFADMSIYRVQEVLPQ